MPTEYDGSPRRFGQPTSNSSNNGCNAVSAAAASASEYSHTSANQTASTGSLLYSATTLTSSAAALKPSTHNNSSSLFSSPRPGFPQRVVVASAAAASQQLDATTAPTMSATPSLVPVHTDDTSNDISEMATSASLSADGTPSESAHIGAQLLLGGGAAGSVRNSTFDYLYEFSETRKVLEEFFKCPASDDKVLDGGSDVDSIVSAVFLRGHAILWWKVFGRY